ncbi:NAD(P)/FAD-dependent oxidoreductase [Natribacillus halophilus]|uniref:NADH dehydrogenase n=1 Tax=Natribacillus halophilus TaxID=549003 RepID=A0A1G8NHJ1_9BACI|nr:NAD(P)/FAD-dependent oxidoreductase [Natribacillus halophilus]SDI79628.1 NADH dehydrogenase [Natribacillus halophilus]
MSKPKIVVLGAGYAGLATTRRLTQKLMPEEADIVLVNKHNYHYESTWLHEVAAGTINHNQARVMLSDVVNPRRVDLIYDIVVEVKKDENTVVLENSELTYDYLVFALGFESNDFGIKGMGENALAIEDMDSSRFINEHMEYQFAKYKNEENPEEHSLNILVGGAGFTGVELVGELVERVPQLCNKYDIDPGKAHIINVEAAPSILPMFDEDLVEYAKKSLEDRGVEFRIGAPISECIPEGFVVGEDEELIKAGTIVWTGGVKGSSVLEKSGFELTKGKVNVQPDLRLEAEENIFVLGDCSWVWNHEEDQPYPPTAQLAVQEGDVTARNVKALLRNDPTDDFVFNDKGTVASLGMTDGIGSVFNNYKLQGKSAAAMKKVVDNQSLFMLGGPKLLLKKGKVRPF